jgi:hypothetical protein
MDNNKEVLIDLKRYKIYWIVMLVLFFIFSMVVVSSINKANEKELAKIEEANKKAELREMNSKIKADSASTESKLLNSKVSGLEKQLSDQNKILNRMDLNYSKSINELINLKNEKDYIPTNVSADEQFKFITNYKYTEY